MTDVAPEGGNGIPKERWLTIALGAAVLVLASMLVFRRGKNVVTPQDGGLAVDAGTLATGTHEGLAGFANFGDGGDFNQVPDMAGGSGAPSDPRAVSSFGARLPDGAPVPPLPTSAPRTVRLGVILVSYSGAQGAAPTARTKAAAAELSEKLAGDAKSDFHGAVSRGDSGSSDDVGRVPRGVLELAPEYAVFTLPVGGISVPIDTPRGFWIAKRIE